MNSDTKFETHFHGEAKGVVIGDNNTVTLIFQTGEQRIVPFLAPSEPLQNLVGRDDLLREIKQRLFAGEPVALHGIPGVGKTAIATALAHDEEVLAHFQDGVLWAGLGPKGSLLIRLAEWAKALKAPLDLIAESTTVDERASAVHNEIGQQRMLLVMDDAWRSEDVQAFRTHIRGPNCGFVLTTRQPRIAANWTTKPIRVKELNRQHGLELLAMLAPDAVQEAGKTTARKLVSIVGGLPLGLTLIGNYLRLEFSTRQHRRLHDAIRRLQEKQAPMQLEPSGKVTLEAVIALSDEALDTKTRKVFYALSVFRHKPSSFSENASRKIAGASSRTIDILAEYGLIESTGINRYTLHQAIDDYASRKLQDKTYEQLRLTVYSSFVRYYMDYVHKYQRKYDKLDVERGNILEAAETAVTINDKNALIEMMKILTVDGYMEARGHTPNLLKRLDDAIAAARDLGADKSKTLHYLLSKRGNTHYEQGNLPEAVVCYQEALDLAYTLALPTREAALLSRISQVRSDLREFETAEKDLQQARQIVSTLEEEDKSLEAYVLDQQGYYANAKKDYLAAYTYFAQELKIAEQLNDPSIRFYTLLNLGSVQVSLKDFDSAMKHFKKAEKLARSKKNRIWVAHITYAYGESYHKMGKREQAHKCLSQAVRLFSQNGNINRRNEVIKFMKRARPPYPIPDDYQED